MTSSAEPERDRVVGAVADHVARLVASSVPSGTVLVSETSSRLEPAHLGPALSAHGFTTIAVDLPARELPAETLTAPPVVAVVSMDGGSEDRGRLDSRIGALADLGDRFTGPEGPAPLLVVAVPNVYAASSVVLDLPSSGGAGAHATALALRDAAVAHGLTPLVAADVPAGPDPAGSTALRDLVDELATRAGVAPGAGHLVRSFRRATPRPAPGTRTSPAERAPFLSVMVRTQGRRSTLTDTLTSLAAQRDGDLEVLLAVHNVEPSALARIERLADAFAPPFAERIRVLPVSGGGRSAPLNAALEAAHGDYVAILDDDDIVTSDWVSAFRRAATAHPGRMVRARCAVQWIEHRDGDLIDFEPVTALDTPFPARFDLLDNVRANRSPPCAYAIPRSLVEDLALRFDDTLQVCEDWKFELEAARLVGVADDPAVTSVYRRWLGDGGSAGAASDEVWIADHMRVVDDLDTTPTVLPPGSLSRIHALYDRIEELETELGRRDPDDPPASFGPEH